MVICQSCNQKFPEGYANTEGVTGLHRGETFWFCDESCRSAGLRYLGLAESVRYLNEDLRLHGVEGYRMDMGKLVTALSVSGLVVSGQ